VNNSNWPLKYLEYYRAFRRVLGGLLAGPQMRFFGNTLGILWEYFGNTLKVFMYVLMMHLF